MSGEINSNRAFTTGPKLLQIPGVTRAGENIIPLTPKTVPALGTGEGGAVLGGLGLGLDNVALLRTV